MKHRWNENLNMGVNSGLKSKRVDFDKAVELGQTLYVHEGLCKNDSSHFWRRIRYVDGVPKRGQCAHCQLEKVRQNSHKISDPNFEENKRLADARRKVEEMRDLKIEDDLDFDLDD